MYTIVKTLPQIGEINQPTGAMKNYNILALSSLTILGMASCIPINSNQNDSYRPSSHQGNHHGYRKIIVHGSVYYVKNDNYYQYRNGRYNSVSNPYQVSEPTPTYRPEPTPIYKPKPAIKPKPNIPFKPQPLPFDPPTIKP